MSYSASYRSRKNMHKWRRIDLAQRRYCCVRCGEVCHWFDLRLHLEGMDPERSLFGCVSLPAPALPPDHSGSIRALPLPAGEPG